MNRRFAILAGLVSVMLLGACGFLPPIPVTDPLGLDGAALEVTVAPAPASLGALAVTASGATDRLSFNDWDLGLPLNPRSLKVDGGLRSSVTVTAPAPGTLPDTLTISNITLTARLWDGAETFDDASQARRVMVQASYTGSLTMSRDPNCAAITCNYTFDRPELLAGSLEVELSGAVFGSALDIIQSSPQPNYVLAEITMTVSGSPADPTSGTIIRFTLDMDRGEVRVF